MTELMSALTNCSPAAVWVEDAMGVPWVFRPDDPLEGLRVYYTLVIPWLHLQSSSTRSVILTLSSVHP